VEFFVELLWMRIWLWLELKKGEQMKFWLEYEKGEQMKFWLELKGKQMRFWLKLE
jgi:hypothetical protein